MAASWGAALPVPEPVAPCGTAHRQPTAGRTQISGMMHTPQPHEVFLLIARVCRSEVNWWRVEMVSV